MTPRPGTTLSIAATVLQEWPHAQVGAFSAKGMVGSTPTEDQVTSAWAAAVAALDSANVTVERLLQNDRIAAWRRALAACGVKASKFRSSPEQLVRRLLAGKPVASPLPTVNLYCAISAASLAPLGAYDLERLPARDIALRLADPDVDEFSPIGGSRDDLPLHPSLVVYAALNEVLCWAWNHRDSRTTCLTPTTQHALFISEAAEACQHQPSADALEAIRRQLLENGAEVSPIRWANGANPTLQI